MSVIKKPFLIILCLVFICPSFFLSSCKKAEERSSYLINAVYTEGLLSGKLRYKFVNSYNQPVDHVDFNLHANAYTEHSTTKPVTELNLAKAYPYGISYGGIQILDVEICQQKREFEIFGESDGFLKVSTPTLYDGDSVEIDISFETVIPKSKLRLGENEHAVNLADFFPTACYFSGNDFLHIPYSPIGDPYFSQISDYVVNLTVPSEYSVASCGTPTFTNVEDLTTTYSYELKSARDFACVLSKNFKVFCQTVNGIKVNYYAFTDDGENNLKATIKALDFLTKTIGKYPYETLTIAESGFLYGGMEFSSLCLINENLGENEKQLALMHEIAHQWWHGGVTNDQNLCAYIDEGLAEFSVFLMLENSSLQLAEEMILNAKQAYKSFFDLQSVLSGNANTVMERQLSTFKSEYEYVNLCYNKPLIMFYEYYQKFGKDKTVNSLKKLYLSNFGKEIYKDEIIKAFGHGDHFNSFIDGKVII